MKMLRNRILVLLAFVSICCSSCQAVWWNPVTWFKKKKPESHIVRNAVIGVGALVLAVIVGYCLGRRSDRRSTSVQDLPHRAFKEKDRLNWQNMHTRVYELLFSLDEKKLIMGQREFTIGGVENRVYQLESSGQAGAQCGPSALFNKLYAK